MAIRYQLDNGLTVVFEPQRTAKVAAFQVWVNVGSADERPDQSGLAHLHEHMLFKGTERRGPGEIARDVEAHGGEINAWTSFDQTVYHIVMASQFAREGLDILADAVRRSAFDPDELAREIEVVCEEIKRSQDTPSRRSSRELFSTAYRVHNYRRAVIGTEETVRSFSREKVLEFYRRFYTPKNLVLAAAGDLDEATFRGWVEQVFGGDWGQPFTGPVVREQEPQWSGRRLAIRPDPVKEAYVNVGFPIPSALHEDTPALDVLAMILGQGDASRLSLEVKRKRGLVNEVHASAYTPQDPGMFLVSSTLQGRQLEAAVDAMLTEVARLRSAPVPDDELNTVKALLESDAVYQRETVQGLARKLGYYQTALGGIEAEARYYEAVSRVTPAQLQSVAQKYLTFDRTVFTALLPDGVSLTEARVNELLDAAAGASPGPLAERRSTRAAGGGTVQVAPRVAVKKNAIHVERLSSGATVIIREESAVPLFAMRAAFAGGVRYEDPGSNGLTTLLARTMTRGTPSRSAEEISHLVDDLAGSLSASGGRNSVSLRGEFLSKHFERGFELFADVLNQPAFPEEELAREKTLLLQDILTREDKPSSVAFELFHKTLFQKHPYRMSTLGERASVERLGRGDLVAYHERYLDPSQLTLCVVGDVRAERVLALAEAAFGSSRGKSAPAPRVEQEGPPETPRAERRELARAQSHLVLGFRGARVDDPWRPALEVLSTLLSGQGGRLFIELRDKRSMAYSVSSFNVEGVDPGYFGVYIGTSPEKVEAALDGIRGELNRIREEPVGEAELERAKQHLIGTHEIGLQRNGARAALLALDHCYGLGLENFLHYDRKIADVHAEHVQEVARKVIDFERSALAMVGP